MEWATGEWSAEFYGSGDSDTDDLMPPSGVAGHFRAITANTGEGYKGVAGAFGANQDDDSRTDGPGPPGYTGRPSGRPFFSARRFLEIPP